jgi:hypothetical protein
MNEAKCNEKEIQYVARPLHNAALAVRSRTTLAAAVTRLAECFDAAESAVVVEPWSQDGGNVAWGPSVYRLHIRRPAKGAAEEARHEACGLLREAEPLLVLHEISRSRL